jgi:hypothetical protein
VSNARLLGARSGSAEREPEREAHIFKNLRERERFGSVFYIIHKYIYIYILMHIYIYIYNIQMLNQLQKT